MGETRRAAVVGLGRMGRAMASRLAEQGWELTTWTRSGGSVDGVPSVGEAADAARAAEVVVLALFDGAACFDVVDAIRDDLTEEVVVVNTSTISPDEAVEVEKQVTATGAGYLHAPVLGSVPAVASGSLTILAGGPSVGSQEARALLDALGSVMEVGDSASAAAAKLMANGVLAGSVTTLGAALSWATELGVDRGLALDVLQRSPIGGLVTGKRARLDARSYEPADFALGALAKDLRLLAASGASAGWVDRHLATALSADEHLGERDVVALADLAAPDLGHGLSLAAGVSAEPAVLAPLVAYVSGHATGDPANFDRAFWPTAHIEGVRETGFTSWTVTDYQALFTGEPAADEPTRRRRIESLDVFDSVATATMTLRHGADTFVDAFVLLQEDGEWRIANKVYQRSSDSA